MAPRSEEQNQIIRDERREEILTHAMNIFARKGYSATKISDVAESASLSSGLVYHYFESKEDMFVAVLSQSIEIMNNMVKNLASLPCEPIEKLKILTRQNIDIDDVYGYACRWLLILLVCLTDSVPRKAHDLFTEKFDGIEFVRDVIKQGQKKGQFSTQTDADTLTTAYWSFMQGLIFFRAFTIKDTQSKLNIPDVDTILKVLM
jgi:AcrR family transcriptional regulator